MNAKKLPQQGRGFDIDADPAALTDRPHSLGSPSLQEMQNLQPLQQHSDDVLGVYQRTLAVVLQIRII
jgi:hypothetical protein